MNGAMSLYISMESVEYIAITSYKQLSRAFFITSGHMITGIVRQHAVVDK